MSSRLLWGLGLAVALSAPASAQQFNTSARPAGGALSARADRAPEMLDLTIRGASESGREDCYGYFEPSAPDAAVEWRGGALRLTVRSSTDATLAVVDPQGVWHCNDDGEGLAPVIELPDAARGTYTVWVGSFSEGGGGAATLVAGRPVVPAAPDASASAQERFELTGGFSSNGAVERTVTAGGMDAIPSLPVQIEGFGCVGFVNGAQPTARVRYTPGGDGRLTLRATTDDADAVLLVRTPGGTWLCDDDSGDGLNPAMAIEDAASGDYAVWVGTFGSLARTEAVPVRLALSEDEVVDADMDFGDMDMMDFEPTPYSTGTYRPLTPDAAPRVRLALATDDAVSAAVTVAPDGMNPVAGDACRGMIEAGPTAHATFSGDGPVGITAAGESDLVLLVQTPAGEWFCSDDADGLSPGVQIDQPEAGAYRVWVGAFSSAGESVDATLTLARGEITVTSGGMGMDGMMGMGEPYAEGTYDGQELLVDQPMTRIDARGDGMDDMAAGGDVTAGGSMMNPVTGPTCGGFIDARPTAAVEMDGDGSFRAEPVEPDDLVMVVRTPDGVWFCSDDADGSSNPSVSIEGGTAGTYSVWVGTFSRHEQPVAAMLTVVR